MNYILVIVQSKLKLPYWGVRSGRLYNPLFIGFTSSDAVEQNRVMHRCTVRNRCILMQLLTFLGRLFISLRMDPKIRRPGAANDTEEERDVNLLLDAR